MKYFKVTCLRGHVGKGRIATITFYICAKDAVKAMSIAQNMGGVKHSKLPLACYEVNETEFTMQKMQKRNAYKECGAKKF